MNDPDALSGLLAGSSAFAVPGSGAGADYSALLLQSVGGRVERIAGATDPHPALDWARSGAMAVTGKPDGPPMLAPSPLASCARGALAALQLLAGRNASGDVDAPALLGEHAAAFGLQRRGNIAPGGTCRLLRAADHWIAVNLARPDDLASLPAWLGGSPGADTWSFVAAEVAKHAATALVERARLVGLPAAVATPPPDATPPWCRLGTRGSRRSRTRRSAPRVVDLSSLWAGPLCGHLLARAGARVIKVESTSRPDGARSGPPAFFDLLNVGKESVALDFRSEGGRAQLRELLRQADIVIESARPRALAQLGIIAEEVIAEVPGLVWVSITGYGRREPGAGWVAFGDDAAVAAGLAVATGSPEEPLFCGDAIADPLTGLHAAVAAFAAFKGGGGALLDLALRDVAAHALAIDAEPGSAQVRAVPGCQKRECDDGWEVVVDTTREPVVAPRMRQPAGAARSLGADTQAVLTELGISC